MDKDNLYFNKDLSYKLIDNCYKLTKSSTPFGYFLANSFFSNERRKVMMVAYSYFRWLDDLIDQPDILYLDSQRLIHRQFELVTKLYSEEKIFPSNEHEQMLYSLIFYDKKKGFQLRNMIQNFMHALSWDVKRKYHVVNQNELDIYSFWLGNAYSEGLLFGIGLNPSLPCFSEPKKNCGIASHLVHILRDFEYDLQLGYINISREDIQKYKVNLSCQINPGLNEWAVSLANKANSLFISGIRHQRNLPNWRSKIIFMLTCSHYMRILKKVSKQWLSSKNNMVLPYLSSLE